MYNQQLVDYLKDCGVCQICQLRYLKARGDEYRDIRESFDRVILIWAHIYTYTHIFK